MTKKYLILLLIAAIACAACKNSKGLEALAIKQLPESLERELSIYADMTGRPKISEIQTVYDSEQFCMLQCKAWYTDSEGSEKMETVRYIFLKDLFPSQERQSPYCDYVIGGRYLSKDEIKKQREKIESDKAGHYTYYLGISKPIR